MEIDLNRMLEKHAVAARPATDVDPTSEILLLGQDYFMLHVDDNGALTRVGDAPPGAITRIVIDPDIFSEMLHRRAHPEEYVDRYGSWLIGITAAGVFLQIKTQVPSQ